MRKSGNYRKSARVNPLIAPRRLALDIPDVETVGVKLKGAPILRGEPRHCRLPRRYVRSASVTRLPVA